MKLDAVVERVHADASAEDPNLARAAVAELVRATVRELGLDVAEDGEVYDPARSAPIGEPVPPPRPFRRGDFLMRKRRR